jgi:ribonuclease HII
MDQTFDKMFYNNCRALAGVDEVGVTAIAGPIVAACVVLPRLDREDNLDLFLIDDSKKIREKYRYESARIVQENAIAYGIGVVPPIEIDALNIYVASNLAMKRAVLDCQRRFGARAVDFCLIDGNREIDLDLPHKLIVKGDMKSLSIAAASIIAKVHRDSLMKEYDKLRPEYHFRENKGYKCEAHYKGLDESGMWVGIHRTSLSPLAKRKGEPKDLTKRRRSWVDKTEETLYRGDSICDLNLDL